MSVDRTNHEIELFKVEQEYLLVCRKLEDVSLKIINEYIDNAPNNVIDLNSVVADKNHKLTLYYTDGLDVDKSGYVSKIYRHKKPFSDGTFIMIEMESKEQVVLSQLNDCHKDLISMAYFVLSECHY